MGEITTVLKINREGEDDKMFIIEFQVFSGSRIIRNDRLVTDTLGIFSDDETHCILNRIISVDGHQIGDLKKHEMVYIVKRKACDGIMDFVFRHKKDAEKCFKRLKENCPGEEITFEKNVIREDYV